VLVSHVPDMVRATSSSFSQEVNDTAAAKATQSDNKAFVI